MEFELVDFVVAFIQIFAMLILLVGVYPFNNKAETSSFLKHGILSILSMGANLATILLFMIPEFAENAISNVSQFPMMWVHASIGIITIIAGAVIIGFWFASPLTELGCAKRWRLMKPTFLIWALTLTLGILITFFEIS